MKLRHRKWFRRELSLHLLLSIVVVLVLTVLLRVVHNTIPPFM